jgi:hypothetical protein
MQDRAAIVLKAPAGMSRSLQNKSKWDNRHKCLLWTVEWILENGSRVFGNCQERRTITEAFANAVGKRKLQNQHNSSSKTATGSQNPASKSLSESDKKNASNPTAHAPSTSVMEHHFYLHRPNLPSHTKCVIPIDPDTVIKDVLRDRVLLEFPTIFVLSAPEEKLENSFITEEEFIKQRGNGFLEVVSEPQMRPVSTSNINPGSGAIESPLKLDEQKVEDLILKDMNS